MQTAMVKVLKRNFSPIPVGRYGKLTEWSNQRRHQAKKCKRSLEVAIVWTLGALHSLRSKKKLAANKQRETHFLSNEEKEKWNQDYIERETAGARKRGEDAEVAIRQEQEDTEAAQNTGLTTREPEKTSQEMMVTMGDNLSDITNSNDGEDTEDEDDDDTAQGQLSEDKEPGRVMGTISKTVQLQMERFRQMVMNLAELTQLGMEHAANYLCKRDKYGTF